MTTQVWDLRRWLWRRLRGGLAWAGAAALALAALQFTGVPWRAYRALGTGGAGFEGAATHVWVPGGSGVPGRSALMRVWYGSEAWWRGGGEAEVWVTLPAGVEESADSRAYVRELELRGVRPEKIRVVDGGRNTREQALCVARTLAAEGGEARVEIVTSPEHVRRCAGALKHAAREEGAKVAVRGTAAMDLSLGETAPAALAGEAAPASSAWDEEDEDAVDEDEAELLGDGLLLRYGVWGNLQYTLDAAREWLALGVYWAKGWI